MNVAEHLPGLKAARRHFQRLDERRRLFVRRRLDSFPSAAGPATFAGAIARPAQRRKHDGRARRRPRARSFLRRDGAAALRLSRAVASPGIHPRDRRRRLHQRLEGDESRRAGESAAQRDQADRPDRGRQRQRLCLRLHRAARRAQSATRRPDWRDRPAGRARLARSDGMRAGAIVRRGRRARAGRSRTMARPSSFLPALPPSTCSKVTPTAATNSAPLCAAYPTHTYENAIASLKRKKLHATAARRSRTLGLPDGMDYEEMAEPNMKLSRALLIVLRAPYRRRRGIIAFNTIKTREACCAWSLETTAVPDRAEHEPAVPATEPVAAAPNDVTKVAMQTETGMRRKTSGRASEARVENFRRGGFRQNLHRRERRQPGHHRAAFQMSTTTPARAQSDRPIRANFRSARNCTSRASDQSHDHCRSTVKSRLHERI